MALTKEDILEGIGALTVIELKELLDAFEERFGVTAAAPDDAAAPAISTTRSVFALSFAHTGTASSARTAVITADVVETSWAKIELRPSRFGHERFTSTAAIRPANGARSSAA